MIEQFLKPATVDEAVRLKRQYGDKAVFMAGGSKLNAAPTRTDKKVAISLAGLRLDAVALDNGQLRLGATLTLQQLIDDSRVPVALREAAGFVYSRNLRNQSTLGGELCAKQDEAVLTPVLLALDAELIYADGAVVALERFLAGGADSADALLVALRLPDPERPCATRKVARSVAGLRVLTAAVALSSAGPCIAVEGVTPTPLRLRDIEARALNDAALEQAVSAAVAPEDDLRGSVAYKRYIAGIVVADLLADLSSGTPTARKEI
ncbi:molybdopterin-dependent oxidoreductase FAD-binding subunit [Propionivibrio dicarboxylicus]|uniref:Putative selenate reductase FAD-binding subunit n=1 Tax=Propionivibrio dicarboxylicus TaxID=83767 RepID=A0A1G8C372_9RHOO|nr:molybdopterin-dependent oxidoreductase FAD-binding subunit [Propionivibrio dicarboxylicus]SDH39941.1 putative selenate reductase FAD-binding subunit [Propionivibrio dicarboxylicus]